MRNVMLGAALIALSIATPAFASDPAPVPSEPSYWSLDGVAALLDNHLNSANTLARSMANECVLASVAAMAVATVATGPVTPAVAAGLGVTQGMSVLSIGAVACGAGAAAGLASAGMITAWEERETIRDVTVTQVAGMWDALSSAGAGIAMAWADPQGPVQAVAATTSSALWTLAGAVGQGAEAAGAAYQTAAAGVSAMIYGPPREIEPFETASTDLIPWDDRQSFLQ